MFLYSTVSTLNPAPSQFPIGIILSRTKRIESKGELTNRRNSGDDFTELELVEDGGLTSGVKTDHQDAHLLATP